MLCAERKLKANDTLRLKFFLCHQIADPAERALLLAKSLYGGVEACSSSGVERACRLRLGCGLLVLIVIPVVIVPVIIVIIVEVSFGAPGWHEDGEPRCSRARLAGSNKLNASVTAASRGDFSNNHVFVHGQKHYNGLCHRPSCLHRCGATTASLRNGPSCASSSGRAFG